MPQANLIADDLLKELLPNRHAHSIGTRKAVANLAKIGAPIRRLLEDAAVLHDIGYSPLITDIGFHPIDGARHLRAHGMDERVVNLVAHHTCAATEAKRRGLGHIMKTEFPYDRTLPHAELCYCDMTTSPTGQPITIEARLADIRERHNPQSIVWQSITESLPTIHRMMSEVQTA